ncbi:hypothetical protein HXZ66_15730 [Bacillus sp. A116_S68]|jgi:hypothetical protein|nr:hypothetical protein HXZ66_15730 [Bacillus sp. A116_S68]
MIKEGLEYLVSLGKATLHYENGQTYSDKHLQLMKDPTASDFTVHSLHGLVEYLESDLDTEENVMVHVKSPTEVACFSAVNSNKNRDMWISAKAMLPSFYFDRFYNTEDFNIKLQSAFVQTEDRDTMLKVVGSIQEEAVKTIGDDGVSQSVTARTGVASVGNVKVPNPVLLAPFRTFIEVQQPSSEFIFRMQDGPSCALFEADGGAWKVTAMANIKSFLEERLSERQNIFIIA